MLMCVSDEQKKKKKKRPGFTAARLPFAGKAVLASLIDILVVQRPNLCR